MYNKIWLKIDLVTLTCDVFFFLKSNLMSRWLILVCNTQSEQLQNSMPLLQLKFFNFLIIFMCVTAEL